MSKLEDNVNEILGIEKKENSIQVSEFEQPAPVPRKIDENKTDIDNDYTHSRDNYYNLIDKGNQAINDILGIEKKTEVAITDFEQPAPVPRKIDETKSDVDNDYAHSRDNYYNLIDKGNEAIEGILDIAKEGQHPRAYEVAGQLIGQVAQTVDKLQDLQKKLKDLKELPKSANTQIKNALFVGSTNELQKMLNRKKEDEIIEGESGQPKEDKTGDK